jgi:PAS domain S-box-containing protein
MLPDSQERAEKQLALLKKQIAQRKEVEEALRRESDIVKLLKEVAVAANDAKTMESAFQFAVDKVCEFTGWPLGRVFRVEPDTGELLLSSIQHCNDEARYRPFIERTATTLSTANREWLGNVLATGKPEWFTNVGQHRNFIGRRSLEETGVKTGFAFPVLVGTEVVAVLEFFSLHAVEPDEELLTIMAHIGSQLGRVVERVQAQETLRESEQRLRHSEALLAEAERIAHLGSWEWDVEQDRVIWSNEMCRIYDLNPGELGFEDFLKRVHPEDRQYAREIVERAYATRHPFEFFHRIVRPDGEVRFLHARGKPVFDETGELIRMVGTGQDVTELKQTEEKLEQHAQQLRALNEMGQTVTASLELEEVFQRVLTTLRPLLQAEGIFILLLDGDEFVFAATDEIGMGSLEGQRVPVTAGVAGEVMDTGRPVWVYGDETRQRVYRQIEEKAGYRPGALLATPLRLRGEWIGVMEAVHSEANAFDTDDLRLMEAAAAWTAIAIGNARLFEAQQRARYTAEVMRNANQALTQTLDLDSVLDSLLEHLQQLIGYDRAVVILRERGPQLRVRAIRGHDADHILNRRLNAGSYPHLQKLLSTHQSMSVADVREETCW